MLDNSESTLVKPSDLGKNPQAIAKRWKMELKLADKRDAVWRRLVTDIYKAYTPQSPERNSFNILWTNTETLRQSVYNSLPQPDVRRRYQDADPLGKQVGEVLTRALEFCQDTYDFDGLLKEDVLTMLLAGRTVSRVRYVPEISIIPGEEANSIDAEGADETSPEANESEQLDWEQVICEKVQWDDFRILCAAKTWDGVTAEAFRHRFTREDCIEKFGEEIGNAIPLDSIDDEEINKDADCADIFKTAEIWEIWDKEEKQVLFICKGYDTPCKIIDDPLKLSGFFPNPKPLYAIENDQTLVPAALFTQYEQQAKELNKISTRINKLIDALRVRGIYDSTLSELSELMKAADNELIPGQNITALLERGGLEKAIWMMPIQDAAMVLRELYSQRDQTKQIIYEITGISDIMRSASDPRETFGAQQIKTQWGTQRLQRMQKEVQRYIRDLVRLKAEIIAEKFQPETLEAMTLVNLPHQAQIDEQKQMMAMQYQQQAMMAQQQGQQPPPPPQLQPDPITWEVVINAMRNDATRTYHVNIETDSTLSATQDNDMQGLKDVLTACAQIMQGFGPAVQQGAMDVEILKELMLSVVRRAKMGTAVEDAIEKMKQPSPPQDQNAGNMQMQMQIEQQKMQMQGQSKMQDLEFEKQKAGIEAQVNAHEQEVQAQQIMQQNQLEAQRLQLESQNHIALEHIRIKADTDMEAMRQQFALMIAQMNNQAKIEVAEVAAGTTITVAQISAANQGSTE